VSYLNCPRIHFAGLFFTNPASLNGLLSNYDLNTPLDYDTGRYMYPQGVAQFWLQNCVVTSVAGPTGILYSERTKDSLVGATVQSVSPTTPKSNGRGGNYVIAKISDLDPNMQFRSELYGIRIYVDIPGGGGFSGRWEVPQLRDMYLFRGDADITGLQSVVGVWHQRLVDLSWTDPTSRSPVYDALKTQATAGLDMKIAVDMYQSLPANEFTQGDIFGYGRLVAAIGPATAEEPHQLVPGRRLYSALAFTEGALEGVGGSYSFTRQAAEVNSNSNSNDDDDEDEDEEIPLNPTDFLIQELPDGKALLNVDLSGTLPLRDRGEGKFETHGSLTFGLLTSSGFKSLRNGKVSLDHYVSLNAATLKLKKCVWPQHSAIVQISLDASEKELISRTPVVVRMDGEAVLQENSDGLYLSIDKASARMEPKSQKQFDVYVYRFGKPQTALPAGLTLETFVSVDAPNPLDNSTSPTQDISVELNPVGSAAGRFVLTLKTGPAVPLQQIRVPLDSHLYFVVASLPGHMVGEDNYLLPDFPPNPPLIALLFWQNHLVVQAPNTPNWANHIGPILRRYARLYPGMKGRLDISDLATVKGFARGMEVHFSLDSNDPGYMPVTRDLSPSTVQMMLTWLKNPN